MPGITLQKFNDDRRRGGLGYRRSLDSAYYSQGRDAVIEQMRVAGIETRPGFLRS